VGRSDFDFMFWSNGVQGQDIRSNEIQTFDFYFLSVCFPLCRKRGFTGHFVSYSARPDSTPTLTSLLVVTACRLLLSGTEDVEKESNDSKGRERFLTPP